MKMNNENLNLKEKNEEGNQLLGLFWGRTINEEKLHSGLHKIFAHENHSFALF